VGVNYITFAAQIYSPLRMQGKKGEFCYLGGIAPLAS